MAHAQSPSNYSTEMDSIFIYSDMPSSSKIYFLQDCDNAEKVALKDISSGKIMVFLVGGIGPVEYTTDKHFENKYEISFEDYGDLPAEHDCMKNYNFLIFAYLNEKYGNQWVREIRKDVYALKEWKMAMEKKNEADK